MTKTIYLLVLAFLIGQTGITKAQSYELDVSSSILNWTGYAEIGNYSQSGTLNFKSGKLTLARGEIKDFNVVVDMTSLAHENDDLENHLKQEGFFYVNKYPTAQMLFIEKKGDKFIFELLIRGKSQKIEVPVNLKKTNGGYSSKGRITIDRTKYDINYNSSSYFQGLGSYAIKNDFELGYELVFKEV